MSKRRVGIRIDMTPMVDIAFLLLIFYMATTQFKPPEARAVELPSSHSQIELPDKDIINVTVTKYDSVYVDYVEKGTINIDGVEMVSNVRRVITATTSEVGNELVRARAKNIRALIVVKADKRATFGIMQDVMDAMTDKEMTRFLIITEQETS
jgi:biopolymer transport protein ExbD